MNETLKRALSGAVYVVLLLGCISYSREGLAILFGAFLIIGVYEFCKMCGLNFYISIPVAAASYYFLWNKNSDLNLNTALTAIAVWIRSSSFYLGELYCNGCERIQSENFNLYHYSNLDQRYFCVFSWKKHRQKQAFSKCFS